jgi:deoxyadenosine/deoxycytidine kinase
MITSTIVIGQSLTRSHKCSGPNAEKAALVTNSHVGYNQGDKERRQKVTQTARNSWYIIIEGAIGVGKTTLARMLRERLNAGLLLEVFEENPFLTSFYRDREQYAFQTQMFFLLSRYRQQQKVPQLLSEGALISDYMFAKDQLFAQINLKGDEWDVYQQMHNALAERIPSADLIIYLQADIDVLMARVEHRDRPYERDMDRAYMEAVRRAYEQFFFTASEIPVLKIDTNNLNFVERPEDLNSVLERINSVLQQGAYQQLLPQFATVGQDETTRTKSHPMAEYQRFHREQDQDTRTNTNIFFSYLCLCEELGRIGSVIRGIWQLQDELTEQGNSLNRARQFALKARSAEVELELAMCLSYLLRLANATGIDLEKAYLSKLDFGLPSGCVGPYLR